jgi:hypothetical protein
MAKQDSERDSSEVLVKEDISSYDRAKWNALVKYDPDIARIAEKLKPLGPKWMNEFASSYLALNDKKYLPAIVQKIIQQVREEGV